LKPLSFHIFSDKTQRGFTLIELVMTIVLLGILSATALPRFADLSGQADASVFDGVKANFKVGIHLVHSKSLINKTDSGYPDISLEGNCIMVNSNSGYPEVDQTTGTCSPVAINFPTRYQPLQAPILEQAIAYIKKTPLPFASAIAAPPPPPPPPPASSTSELPSLLMDGDFTDWTWSKSAPNATFTSPGALSFTYNHDTGNVN